jgi:hypothetical protein
VSVGTVPTTAYAVFNIGSGGAGGSGIAGAPDGARGMSQDTCSIDAPDASAGGDR